MKLTPYIQNIFTNQPHLHNQFIIDYAQWADKIATEKPYHYGNQSLKWVLSFIHKQATPSQFKAVINHIVTELATMPPHQVPEKVQFKAMSLQAVKPYKTPINRTKTQINIDQLNNFTASRYKFIENPTEHNLTSMIFRKSNADAIIFHNPELQSAGIIFRVNSRIMLLSGFKQYLIDTIFHTEPGWKQIPQHNTTMLINHGIQSKTPTSYTTNKLKSIIQNYFK